MRWRKTIHNLYKLGNNEDLVELLPKEQWRSGRFSIIPPCVATMGFYELYDGEEIYRFNKLEDAKNKAEELN